MDGLWVTGLDIQETGVLLEGHEWSPWKDFREVKGNGDVSPETEKSKDYGARNKGITRWRSKLIHL